MKKQSFIFILLISCFSTISIAQIKPQKKATNKPMLEIDRLYAKYKNLKTITLVTTKGDFEGNVSIELNESKKPISVIIEGETGDSEALSEFIYKTIKMKLKQYNQSEPIEMNAEYQDIQLVYHGISENYSKGDLYFNVEVNRYPCDENGNLGFSSDGKIYFKYRWKIETGNNRRKISENAKPFVF